MTLAPKPDHDDGLRDLFVISPIGSPGTSEHRRAKLLLDFVIKKAFTRAGGWDVMRADLEAAPDSITSQVIGRIHSAELIVADLTDHNPNVFYELAVAHGYSKRVIHMLEKGQKVPFDVVDQRVIFYDLQDPESVDSAIIGLMESAKWLDQHGDESRNPLSTFGQFNAIRSSGTAEVDGEALVSALTALSSQVSNLQREVQMMTMPRDVVVRGSSAPGWTRSGLRRDEVVGLEGKISKLLEKYPDAETRPPVIQAEMEQYSKKLARILNETEVRRRNS